MSGRGVFPHVAIGQNVSTVEIRRRPRCKSYLPLPGYLQRTTALRASELTLPGPVYIHGLVGPDL
jgi:hypothetical protein